MQFDRVGCEEAEQYAEFSENIAQRRKRTGTSFLILPADTFA